MSHVQAPPFGDLAAEAREGTRPIFAGSETALSIVAEQNLPVLIDIAPRTGGSGKYLGPLTVRTMPGASRSGHMGRQPVATLSIPLSYTPRILGSRQTGSSARTDSILAGPTLAPAAACGTSGGQ
jgi:hypothetical protein